MITIRQGQDQQSANLMERIKAVRDTGIADEIIVEEYEGKKSMIFVALVWTFLPLDLTGRAILIT